MDEAVGETDINYLEFDSNLKDGDIVTLRVIEDSWDFESGQCDGWHPKVVLSPAYRITKEQSLATPENLISKVVDAMNYLVLTYEEALEKVKAKEKG